MFNHLFNMQHVGAVHFLRTKRRKIEWTKGNFLIVSVDLNTSLACQNEWLVLRLKREDIRSKYVSIMLMLKTADGDMDRCTQCAAVHRGPNQSPSALLCLLDRLDPFLPVHKCAHTLRERAKLADEFASLQSSICIYLRNKFTQLAR